MTTMTPAQLADRIEAAQAESLAKRIVIIPADLAASLVAFLREHDECETGTPKGPRCLVCGNNHEDHCRKCDCEYCLVLDSEAK